MQEQKFDMEVTEYRKITMIETLAKLYAHQVGMEIKNLRIYPVKKDGEPLREVVWEQKHKGGYLKCTN